MKTLSLEKILVVESDPQVRELISRQVLGAYGYQVEVASDGAQAIQMAALNQPDLLITNLNLPGLSGKDLLLALSSQGISIPVIVLARKGQETSVIQAFHLGAADFLQLPLRETEIIASVESVLNNARNLRNHEILEGQNRQIQADLQKKISDLKTVFSVGRAVNTITEQRTLLNKMIETATTVSGGDFGWLTLKSDSSNSFRLAAHYRLPRELSPKICEPFQDDLCSTVVNSGETLVLESDALKKYNWTLPAHAALLVPIKGRQETIGVIILLRRKAPSFEKYDCMLAETIADYASISLVNSRLFHALSRNTEASHQRDKQNNDLIQNLGQDVQSVILNSLQPLDYVLSSKAGPLNANQQKALEATQTFLQQLVTSLQQRFPR